MKKDEFPSGATSNGVTTSLLGRSPLAKFDWEYTSSPVMDDYDAADWKLLERQGREFYVEFRAQNALGMLEAGRDLPSYGYPINNYRHSLQSATLVMQAGRNEEDIVVALFHDIGFIACPETHGQFAAAFLAPLISEGNKWMLEHHLEFIDFHAHECPDIDRHKRDEWQGHPHFEWTAEFVKRFDQAAMDSDFPTASIDVFVPMVHRLFSKSPDVF